MLCFCIPLQVIKNWSRGRPGNEARVDSFIHLSKYKIYSCQVGYKTHYIPRERGKGQCMLEYVMYVCFHGLYIVSVIDFIPLPFILPLPTCPLEWNLLNGL